MVHTTLCSACWQLTTLTSNLSQVHRACHHTGEHGLQCNNVKELCGGENGPTCPHSPITIVHCNGSEGQLGDSDGDDAVCGIMVEVKRLGDVVSGVIHTASYRRVECVVHRVWVDGVRVGGVDRHISCAGAVSIGCERNHSLLVIQPDNRGSCVHMSVCACVSVCVCVCCNGRSVCMVRRVDRR